MKKISFVVENIKEEPSKYGPTNLRIRVKSNGKLYTFAAKKLDYLDDRTRENLHEVFIKSIKEREAEEKEGLETPEGKKAKRKLDSLVGKTVDEEE